MAVGKRKAAGAAMLKIDVPARSTTPDCMLIADCSVHSMAVCRPSAASSGWILQGCIVHSLKSFPPERNIRRLTRTRDFTISNGEIISWSHP